MMISVSIATAVMFVGPTSGPKPPKWFDTSIASYSVSSGSNHRDVGIFDPKSGYYLLRSIECDGAIVTVLLTRDRHEIADNGYFVPGISPPENERDERTLKPKRLPSLATHIGVRISDSPEAVVRRLGKPSKTERTGSRHQFLTYTYSWTHSSGETEEGTYEQIYTFKVGKLVEICYCSDESVR